MATYNKICFEFDSNIPPYYKDPPPLGGLGGWVDLTKSNCVF